MKAKEITIERTVDLTRFIGKYNILRHSITVTAEEGETSKELFDAAHIAMDASLQKYIRSTRHLNEPKNEPKKEKDNE